MGFCCWRERHPRSALAGPYNPNSSIVMRKDFIPVQKNLRGSKRMTRHGFRLLLVLMLGTWLGACSTPSSESVPSLPIPESSPSRESQHEDPPQPPNEQTEQHPQDSSRQPQETIDPEARPADAQAPVRTDDEEVAVLDQQLEEALGRYDEQIHKEFEKAQAERRAHGQEVPAGTGQEAGSERESAHAMDSATQVGETSGAEGQASTRSSSAEIGDADDDSKESAEEHKNRGTHSAPPPADIPSGDDDDVVARQLREAAQKERDPVLRDKLWDEYRKYKKQQASATPSPAAEGE